MDTCAEPTTYEVALGDGFKLLFPLTVDGVASPIAGWVPKLVITESLDDESVQPLATLALGDGLEGFDANTWLANILAALLAAAVAGNYFYAFRAVDPEGQTQTLETGYVKFFAAGPAPS